MSKPTEQNKDKVDSGKSTSSYKSVRYLQGCSAIISAWHSRLIEVNNTQDTDESGEEAYSAFFRNNISSSDIAKLRRCRHIDEVAMQPAFIALWQQITNKLPSTSSGEMVVSDATFNAWLAVAWVLAQVRQTDNRHYVKSQGKGKYSHLNNLAHVAGSQNNGRPNISPLRFEKLVSARNPDDFVQLLSRIVKQLQQQRRPLNAVFLANDIMHRFADFQGSGYRNPREKLIVQWSLSYYQASAA